MMTRWYASISVTDSGNLVAIAVTYVVKHFIQSTMLAIIMQGAIGIHGSVVGARLWKQLAQLDVLPVVHLFEQLGWDSW